MFIRKEIIVKNKLGLHARPASMFVKSANKFNSRVSVEKAGDIVDGKSIISILTLAIEFGNRIYLEAEGEDAEEAMNELEKIIGEEG